MLDIETLGLGPRVVTTQVAMIAFDIDDPSTELRTINEYLPIQPQLGLGRTVTGSTLIWWMGQEEKARKRFANNSGDDLIELEALCRSIVRKFNQITDDGRLSYELWAKGPQFDVVNLESLLVDLGFEAPWKYDSVRDLRTLMKIAGLSTKDVELGPLQAHVAIDDCRFQIRCYEEALRKLGSKS
jgi:hypothetical protein